MKADEDFADFPIDLGAEWIHNLPGILDVLSGVEGTASQTDLIPYHLKSAATWNGRRLRQHYRLELDAFFRFFPEFKFKSSTWYDFFRRHFADEVQHRIQYNSPVAKVDYSGERVEVTTANGERFVVDKVIMTASIGVLRSGHIAFVPELSQRKKDALASVEFLPGFKLLLKFSEKFYPDAISIKGSSGEQAFYDVAFRKDAPPGCHVLGLLVTGHDATAPYYALGSEEQIVTAALTQLDAMFPKNAASRAYTGEYRLEDWGRRPFVLGTWVEGFKIGRATRASLNTPLGDKVYFAGEAHDVHRQMGVPGAVLSGLHAVDRLVRAGAK